MSRIKSSLEIAMERLKKQQSGEQQGTAFDETGEYIKAAKILARSLLQGKTDQEEIKDKLERYPQQAQAAALRTIVEELAAEMNLQNTPVVLEAIRLLDKNDKTETICEEAAKLYQQYNQKVEARLAQLTATLTQQQSNELSQREIKGSAIAGFNVKGTAAWHELQEQLEKEYKGALENIRSSLKQQLDGG